METNALHQAGYPFLRRFDDGTVRALRLPDVEGLHEGGNRQPHRGVGQPTTWTDATPKLREACI